jgi:hypothetical protein
MRTRLIVSMLFLMPLVAQQAPTNLKILKPEELMPAMQSYTVALGQQCGFCHVQGDRASDANPHKGIAREMIAMTQQINSHFPGGAKVACYTCHRGSTQPLMAPPAGGMPGR